ncbi:MAG: 5-methyltetrahydropteroyltriglutamate--homocysteine S-methyltransferase [Deltaproteobacteria bacterium]|nr:5-methyltetrahydropteroyltriglutamate--homocysteine S-methyltransferase [Deltaproteobacteria bacterium]
MEILTSNLGYPRIGKGRELKRALEGYWQDKISEDKLKETALNLQVENWGYQREIGIDLIPVNDFSLYDHMLDMATMFGFIPKRFKYKEKAPVPLSLYFTLARGREGIAPLEMTKWFDTNYHYLVPELDTMPCLLENRPLISYSLARERAGINGKPVIVGPYTFLRLSKIFLDKGSLISALIDVYKEALISLKEAGAVWVQMDEPALVLDLDERDIRLVEEAYKVLADIGLNIILQTYFGALSFYERIINLPIGAIGLDLVRGEENLENIRKYGFPSDKILSLGIVDGRNVWRTDLNKVSNLVKEVLEVAKPKGLILQPSCSLIHLPISIELEGDIDSNIKGRLSFANERLKEIVKLARMLKGEEGIKEDVNNFEQIGCIPEVRERVKHLKASDFERGIPYEERRKRQQAVLNLPLFPTTTIGSFPQTGDVRRIRARYKKGQIGEGDYKAFIRERMAYCIGVQEGLGLDVLVHGEFERSDMVEYFAQKLTGFLVTKNGWVQSYGSRCTRPPIIYGDVSRKGAMTLEEITFAQSLTKRPVKGMITGPVTILNWSFVRNDIPKKEVAYQIALALKEEVLDLEKAGIKIIQIDEPALREGLPLKKRMRRDYLEWAVKAFRLVTSKVRPETQIHTHMCYAEFSDIIEAIDGMDADVISIECSRSQGDNIDVFEKFHYKKGIGLGVYDIHSPRVPSTEEILVTLRRCLKVLRPEQLWVNPDCGLKTRQWEEVIPSLKNMVKAAEILRGEIAK